MASMKLFFIIFGLLIVQAHCSIIRDDDPDDGDTETSIIDALKIIVKIVDFITEYGIATINALNNASGVIEDKIHDIEETLIDAVWNYIASILEDVEIGGTDFVKAAIQCTTERGDNLKAMYFNFTYTTSVCEVQKQLWSSNAMLPLLNHTRSTNDELKKFINQIEECGTDEDSVSCINEILAKIYETATNWFYVLADDISKASDVLELVDLVTSSSQQKTIANLKAENEGISNDILECIKDKINL